MENGVKNRKMSFEVLRRRSVPAETQDRSAGKLFEKDWEVFVARFDREAGRFVTKTFCCEDAVT